jgi:dihydropteroate synthase
MTKVRLRARNFVFDFPRPALVMGIVNVTPDSFSDGGRFLDPAAALDHALRLVSEGADIIDLGGESTRPRAEPVSEAEELRRVLPALEALAGRLAIPISIDTMKVGVARAALRLGASIVNDVGANRMDGLMGRLIAETGAGYVCVHMQGTPQTMQASPAYEDVVREVDQFFSASLRQLEDCGVNREQIIFDAGIGFGKTLEHNLELLGALKSFTRLARPLLLGVSRKSFLGGFAGSDPMTRLPGALACAALAIEAGVHLIRTHDVAATVQAIRTAEAILARRRE